LTEIAREQIAMLLINSGDYFRRSRRLELEYQCMFYSVRTQSRTPSLSEQIHNKSKEIPKKFGALEIAIANPIKSCVREIHRAELKPELNLEIWEDMLGC
jgi:hypothetical protein